MVQFTHFDEKGKARMVDVSSKEVSEREAVAGGAINMQLETFRMIQEGRIEKGDVLTVARVAGIMAAKKTSDMIPMCHPLRLSLVEINFTFVEEEHRIDIESLVRATDRTGVEMEAMVAVLTAAATIYDMCKAVDRAIVISDVHLLRKSGGKSGEFIFKEKR